MQLGEICLARFKTSGFAEVSLSVIPIESGCPAEPTPIPTESGRSSSNPIDSMTAQIGSEVGANISTPF